MRLLTLEAENLFSLGKLSLPLDKRGLVLVTGWSEDERRRNGAGKSSATSHAILWALYGRLLDSIPADAVVNRRAKKKKAWARIRFEAFGKQYEIFRQRNPALLTLKCGTEDLTLRNMGETQTLIDQSLGRSFSTFIQADYFGEGRSASYPSLTPKEQKAILEEILPFSRLDRWLVYTKEQIETVRIKTTHLNSITAQTLRVLHLVEEELNTWKGVDPQDLKDLLNKVPDDLDTRLNLLEEKREEVNSQLGTIQSQIAVWEAETRLWETFQSTKTCPTCRRPMDEDVSIKLNEARNNCAQLAQRHTQWQEHLQTKITEIKKLQPQLQLRQQLLAQLPQARAFALQKNRLDNKLKAERKSLDETKAQLKVASEELAHLLFWQNAFAKDLRLSLLVAACPFLNTRVQVHLAGLGNAHIEVSFQTVKPLAGGDLKEEFFVHVLNRNGGEGFGSLSGGEKQIVSFAVGLALADLAASRSASSSKLLILDEPFTYCDNVNAEAIVNYLTGPLSKQKETIVLVSNEESLKGLIPNRIHIIKRNGISEIENADGA